MSKNILFATLSLITIFNHQYMCGADDFSKMIAKKVEADLAEHTAKHAAVKAVQAMVMAEINTTPGSIPKEVQELLAKGDECLKKTERDLLRHQAIARDFLAMLSERAPASSTTVSASAADTASTASTAPVRVCDECKDAVNKIFRCGGCQQARYCSRTCQITAWRTHKGACGINLNNLNTSHKK